MHLEIAHHWLMLIWVRPSKHLMQGHSWIALHYLALKFHLVSHYQFRHILWMHMTKAILSEGLCTIYKDTWTLKECDKLFDITIPSTLHSVAVDKFEGSPFVLHTLVRRYIDLTEDTFYYVFSTLSDKGVTLDEMRQRFDNLPLHRHCYFCDSSHNEHHFESRPVGRRELIT
jgi:hypothetical protein